jgi:hypothetical protein
MKFLNGICNTQAFNIFQAWRNYAGSSDVIDVCLWGGGRVSDATERTQCFKSPVWPLISFPLSLLCIYMPPICMANVP